MKSSPAYMSEVTTPKFVPLGATIDPDFDLHAFDLEFLTNPDGTVWQDTMVRWPREAR